MSADNSIDNAAVFENTDALVAWMAAGARPSDMWRIGTEHEKLGFCRANLTPLPYEGERGIRALLEGLMRFGWQGIYEGVHLIALVRDSEQGRASITLEPGGQLELSGAPLASLHETCAEVSGHLKEVQIISQELGQGWLGTGFSPLWGRDDAVIMPKARYKIMRDYMPKRGTYGHDMMYLSCTVQVNLDFASEADMIEKFRIALAFQPLVTALFANSPFRDGTISDYLSVRAHAWLDTDPDRTGMLPFAFESDFGFARYVDYALDVPMYFVHRNGIYIDSRGQSFRDFLRGQLPALPGEKPRVSDWENHLSTLFPEARLKRFIEMRGADSGLRHTLCALPALWVGLLYHAPTQAKITELIADWSDTEREYLHQQVPKYGLATPFRDGTLLDVARIVVRLADNGLRMRAICDVQGQDERQFLAPIHTIIEQGHTSADILRAKYHGAWHADIRPIFSEMAF